MSSNDMTSASQNVLKLVKLSRQEFNNITEAYAERVVNNMDTQTLEQLVRLIKTYQSIHQREQIS